MDIKNPSNVSGQNYELDFSSRFASNWNEKFSKTQQAVDNAVLRYTAPYVPFQTGTLERSGITNTVVGSGLVEYSTPYARRLYYNPQYTYNDAPMRGGMWFERMKADKKPEILKIAKKELD